MCIHVIRLIDKGAYIDEDEVADWRLRTGDMIFDGDPLCAAMLDKHSVKPPYSVQGKVVGLGGGIEEKMPIATALTVVEIDVDGNDKQISNASASAELETERESTSNKSQTNARAARIPTGFHARGAKRQAPTSVLARALLEGIDLRHVPKSGFDLRITHDDLDHWIASVATSTRVPTTIWAQATQPQVSTSVFARARLEGIDLRHLPVSGPDERITHDELDRWITSGSIQQGQIRYGQSTGVKKLRVIGMRRYTHKNMLIEETQIPYSTAIEEVEIDRLDALRIALNNKYAGQRRKQKLLPFLMHTIVQAVCAQTGLKARYVDEAGAKYQYGDVHVAVGMPVQSGLQIPMNRTAMLGSLWDNAAELNRLANAASDVSIKRKESQNSTISIRSHWSTIELAVMPIISYREVAIVGFESMQIRPVWDGQQFSPKKMMNISCSFDRRVVEGRDAGVFVQKLKSLLETPATFLVNR